MQTDVKECVTEDRITSCDEDGDEDEQQQQQQAAVVEQLRRQVEQLQLTEDVMRRDRDLISRTSVVM